MQILVNGSSDSPSNSAVRYATIYGAGRSGWQSTEGNAYTVMPTSGKFVYLRATGPDPGAGKSRAFTLRVNGADTSLVATSVNGVPYAEAYGSVAVVAGDLVNISQTPSGSPTNGSFEWDIGFEPDDETETIILPSSGSAVVSATNGRYISMNGDTSGDTTTAFDASLVMPMSGTFTGLYCHQDTAPGSGNSRIYTLVKNGVDTAITVTISGASATTGSDFADSFTVVAGDTVALRIDEGGATTNTRIRCGVIFKPDAPGKFICSGGSPSNITIGPFYNFLTSGFALWPSALGNFNRPSKRWIALESHVMLDVAPGVGKSRSFRSYNFLGQPGFNVVIADTATYGSAQGSLVAGYNFLGAPISDTQLYIQAHAVNSPATTSVIWSYVCMDRQAHIIT